MTSHHKPLLEDMPTREPIKPRRHVPHIKHVAASEPRVRPLRGAELRQRLGTQPDKSHLCIDCRARFKGHEAATRHWRAHHDRKAVVLTDMICVSVHVEGEA